MKPFDLEAAKRGEPIQAKVPEARLGDPLWFDADFIGVTQRTEVVIDSAQYGLERVAFSDLRMKTRKRTVWVTLFEDGEAVWTREDTIGQSSLRVIAGAVPVVIEE